MWKILSVFGKVLAGLLTALSLPLLVAVALGMTLSDREAVFLLAYGGHLTLIPLIFFPAIVGIFFMMHPAGWQAFGAFSIYGIALGVVHFAQEHSQERAELAAASFAELKDAYEQIPVSGFSFKENDKIILRTTGRVCAALCIELLVFTGAESVTLEHWTPKGRDGKVKDDPRYRDFTKTFQLDTRGNCVAGNTRQILTLTDNKRHQELKRKGLGGFCAIEPHDSAVEQVWIVSIDASVPGREVLEGDRHSYMVRVELKKNEVVEHLVTHRFGDFSLGRTRGQYGYPEGSRKHRHYNVFATVTGLPLQ